MKRQLSTAVQAKTKLRLVEMEKIRHSAIANENLNILVSDVSVDGPMSSHFQQNQSATDLIRRLPSLLKCILACALIGLVQWPLFADEAADDYSAAVSLYKRGRWSQAAEEFQNFVKKYARHEKAPLARLYLGLTHIELSDFKSAREELRKFADENRQNPNYSQARYRIGECSYLLDDLPNARIELEKFVQDFPNDPMCEHAMPYLGETLLRLKDPAAALVIFDKAIEKYPNGKLVDDAKFARARALESLKRDDEAMQQYQQLASQKDGLRAADALFHLGASYFEKKQFPESIAAYRSLVKDYPQSPLAATAQLNAGYACFQSGKFDDAARHFELAAKDPPQTLTAHYWQGRSLKSMGDYAKAAEVLKTAAQESGNSPLAEAILYEQGLCERYMSHPLEARAYFEQVLAKFPTGDLADDSLHALIEMSIELGDFTEADQLLARFQKDFPQSGLRLHIEMLNGRLALARAGAVLRDQPASPDAAALYEAAGKRFEQVMKDSTLPKTKGQARYYLALTRQLQGNQTQALELISPLVEQALADPSKTDFADGFVLQSECYFQQQKYEQASAAAAKYAELFPKGRQLARALSIRAVSDRNLNLADSSTAMVKRLSDEFPTHPVTFVTLQQIAEAAEAKDDWATALQMYDSLTKLQKDPEKRAYALRGVALCQYRQEKFVDAADTFGLIVTESPKHTLFAESLYYQADSLRKADQTDKALPLFKKLFESYPLENSGAASGDQANQAEFVYKAGLQAARILNRAGKVVEADAAYEALLKKFPQPIDLDKRLDEWAILNYQHNRFDQADAIWKRLIEQTPQSPLVSSARLSLAESDLVARKFDDARKVFEELSESDKSTDDVKEQSLYQLVVLAVEFQKWADVRSLGNRLTTQFPKSKHRFYILYSQVEALLALENAGEQDLVEAREQLRMLHAESANDEVNDTHWFDRSFVLLAEINFREKKYAEVISTVEDFEQKRPKSPFLYQAFEVLGRCYKQQAKFDSARAAFEKVLADSFAGKSETAAKAQFLIGDTWFLQEKWNAASLAYQRVYSIYKYPEWQAAALLMSGRCDENQGDLKAALETFKLVISEFPQSSVIEETKTRLEAVQKKLGR